MPVKGSAKALQAEWTGHLKPLRRPFSRRGHEYFPCPPLPACSEDFSRLDAEMTDSCPGRAKPLGGNVADKDASGRDAYDCNILQFALLWPSLQG